MGLFFVFFVAERGAAVVQVEEALEAGGVRGHDGQGDQQEGAAGDAADAVRGAGGALRQDHREAQIEIIKRKTIFLSHQ